MAVEFLTDEAFSALPENKPAPKTDEFWDPVIAALGEGKIVKLQFSDEKEKRGRRLALGRRSKRAGFSVEIRYGDGFLAARRSSQYGDDNGAASTDAADRPTRRKRKTDD
jgi:hypothetical protein